MNVPIGVALESAATLSTQATRAEGARTLAVTLGVEEIILLARDATLGVLLPAPCMPQTLNGGPAWKALVERCSAPGCYRAEVDLPRGALRPAAALACDGAAFVCLGGAAASLDLEPLEPTVRVLAAVLAAEQDAVLARAEAAAATDAAQRAGALARALEAARADTARLNAELRQEQLRKDEFLAMLGHELRNPLSPLVTSVELLRRHQGPVPQQIVGVMSRQLTHLKRLVDDLLDVARVTRGRIELKRELLPLGDAVADAIAANRQLLDSQQMTVEVCDAGKTLHVYGDRVRLTQVFANLINNAAKYTDRGGRVAISLAAEGPDVVVSVRDTGIGIPVDMLPRVFELFTQGPGSLERSRGGLGIGLMLSRTLVELHGGRVIAESPGEHKGSTFTVRLPLAAAGAALEHEARDSLPAHDHFGRVVLVVDDNKDAADATADLLRHLGNTVLVAYDGSGALRAAEGAKLDLILLDIALPDITGYALAQELRRMTNGRAHLVALTGFGSAEAARRAKEAGFDRFVVKPIEEAALRALMAETTDRK